MSRLRALVTGLIVASIATQAQAYTSRGSSTITVAPSGVTESTTFATAVVVQGSGTDTPATLGFGTGPTAGFRDSDESIRVSVDTNVVGNRVIIYTNNLAPTASPQACLDTSTGIDGGGLVGVTDCSRTVPLLWAVFDTNVNHTFTAATVGDDEIYITDRAHVASFTTGPGVAPDNQAMALCRDLPAITPVANASNDGLYPQFFGNPGLDEDLCDPADTTPPFTVVSQELSKNIAVNAFGFNGTVGLAPNLATPSPSDSITVTSPYYLAVGADFTGAAPQNYATNTLTLELVTQ
jgi:hypothetical protein